jgi:methyl-accepting chemotaxis protein
VRITVAKRLAVLGVMGSIFVAVVAGIGYSGAVNQGQHAGEMAAISDGMSSQWNADMMHDGIRADVMAAMYARTDKQREIFETADVSAKAKTIVDRFDAAAAQAPSAVAAQFEAARPKVVKYAEEAVRLVELAAKDKAAAEEQLPAFLDLFGQLEEELGAVDDAMLGAVESAKASAQASANDVERMILITGLLALLAFAGVSLWLARSMLIPLRALLAALRTVAQRDLTTRVETTGNDEFGEMGEALNHALDEIRDAIRSAGDAASTLTGACDGLTSISGQLGTAARQTANEAEGVSHNAEEVSANVSRMSMATDQMGSAITEIAGQTSAAAQVAAEAVQATETTSQSVADLNRASEEIGEIVKAITTIAEQTNLLALNATIEAARAGDAGKGFAVVATEVKELSQETGRATDDITAKIEMIQAMTAQASLATEAITDVIGRINENQSMIAAAVEEQSATTAEISRGVSDIAHGAMSITERMASIHTSTTATSDSATSTQESANELATLASNVASQINRFKY